jgi:hypothetical protein
MLLICLYRKLGLGLKEMIEAALVDLGPLTDVIYANRPIAILPDQVDCGLKQLKPGVTF